MRRVLWIAAVGVVAVALSWVVLRRDHGQTPTDSRNLAGVKATLGPTAAPAEVGSAVRERAQQHLARAGVREKDAVRLSELTESLLSAYQQSDPSAFFAVLESQGLQPDHGAERERIEAWNKSGAVHFIGATFYPEHSSWRPVVIDGRPVPKAANEAQPPVSGGLFIEQPLETPRGTNDVVDARQAGTTQVRLLLPAELTDAQGARTLCQLELLFTRRPADGEWILTGSGLQNVPKEHFAIAAPPIR